MGSGAALSRVGLSKRQAGGEEISIANARRRFPMVNVPTAIARPLIESVSLKENRPTIHNRVNQRRSEPWNFSERAQPASPAYGGEAAGFNRRTNAPMLRYGYRPNHAKSTHRAFGAPIALRAIFPARSAAPTVGRGKPPALVGG